MTGAIKSKEAARTDALGWCADFLWDWSRVYSILGLMEETVNAEVKEAQKGDDKVDSWIADEFSANVFWLRNQLSRSAKSAQDALQEAGYSAGPRE